MYNTEVKQHFLEEISIEREPEYKQLFNVLEAKEKQFEADLCEMSLSQAKQSLISLNTANEYTLNPYLSRLRKYCDWAILNGYSSKAKNVFREIKAGDVLIMHPLSMIGLPQELENMLCRVFDYNKNTTDSQFIAFMWLLYSGVDQYEAAYLLKSEVDLQNGIIYLKHGNIKLISQAWRYLKQFSEAKSVYSDYFKREDPVQNGIYFLIQDKTYEPSNILQNKFRPALILFRRKYEKITGDELSLTLNKVILSGIFWRMYEIERSNQEIDSSEYMSYISKRGQKKLTSASDFKHKSTCIKEYQMWKQEFILKQKKS